MRPFTLSTHNVVIAYQLCDRDRDDAFLQGYARQRRLARAARRPPEFLMLLAHSPGISSALSSYHQNYWSTERFAGTPLESSHTSV